MPDEPAGAERRQHARLGLSVEVALEHRAQTEKLTVINISAGGILLRNDRNAVFAVGETISVQFDVAELSVHFSIEAKVIRVVQVTTKPGAIAAMWTSSDARATAGLSEVLWSLSNRR